VTHSMPRSRRRLIRKRPSGRSWWPVFVAVAVGASLGVVLVARSQQWGLDGGVAAHADRHGHTAKTTYTQPPTLHPPALRGPGRPAQPQLVERSGDGSGPSPAVLAAVSEAADNKFVPGSFARHWGWKDCKSWSFGIGIARSPLEPPLWSLEVVSPFVLWDEFDFAAPVADSLAQLLTADPFLVPGDDEANWYRTRTCAPKATPTPKLTHVAVDSEVCCCCSGLFFLKCQVYRTQASRGEKYKSLQTSSARQQHLLLAPTQ